MAERQSARMSKITNDGLTRSAGTGCFTAGNSGRERVKMLSVAVEYESVFYKLISCWLYVRLNSLLCGLPFPRRSH